MAEIIGINFWRLFLTSVEECCMVHAVQCTAKVRFVDFGPTHFGEFSQLQTAQVND